MNGRRLLEIRNGHMFDRSNSDYACIVDEHVETSVTRHGIFDRPPCVALSADISGQDGHVDAVRLEILPGAFELRGVASHEDHTRAQPSKLARNEQSRAA
jgi:hypothetical protein